jgi:hypothetical protein
LGFEPAQIKRFDEIRAASFFAIDVPGEITRLVAENPIAPAVALAAVSDSRVNALSRSTTLLLAARTKNRKRAGNLETACSRGCNTGPIIHEKERRTHASCERNGGAFAVANAEGVSPPPALGASSQAGSVTSHSRTARGVRGRLISE